MKKLCSFPSLLLFSLRKERILCLVYLIFLKSLVLEAGWREEHTSGCLLKAVTK